MGQQEVYNFLKRHRKKWFSARKIADKLKVSSGSVITCLKKLRKAKIVNYRLDKRPREKSGKRKIYVYRFRK